MVRAKRETYNGEQRVNVTCADVRPVVFGVHGRSMLNDIREMLSSFSSEPVAAC